MDKNRTYQGNITKFQQAGGIKKSTKFQRKKNSHTKNQ